MITPRLDSILNNVSGTSIADIGTDHAYIPIELMRRGRIERAIACDIKPGPLEFAARNVKKYNLEEKIELRLGAGLEPLEPGEVEAVVIAGMGGEMIMKILAENLNKARSFSELILQPMNCQAELRVFLAENGFDILAEDLAVEGFKVYNLLKVGRGQGAHPRRELDAHLPPELYSHRFFAKLLEKKHREFTKILTGLKRAEEKDTKLIEKYEGLLKEMNEL